MGNSPTYTTLTHLCKGQRQRTISCCHHLVQIQYEHTLFSYRMSPRDQYEHNLSTQMDEQYHHWDKHLLSRGQYKNGPVWKLQQVKYHLRQQHPSLKYFWSLFFLEVQDGVCPQLVFQTQIVNVRITCTHSMYRCSSTAGSQKYAKHLTNTFLAFFDDCCRRDWW